MALLPAPIAMPAAGLVVDTGFTAAAGGGDTLAGCEDGRVFLVVKNADTSAKSVTIADPGRTPAGNPGTTTAVSVANGTIAMIPVPAAAVASDGLVSITYSAVTALSLKAVRR